MSLIQSFPSEQKDSIFLNFELGPGSKNPHRSIQSSRERRSMFFFPPLVGPALTVPKRKKENQLPKKQMP